MHSKKLYTMDLYGVLYPHYEQRPLTKEERNQLKHRRPEMMQVRTSSGVEESLLAIHVSGTFGPNGLFMLVRSDSLKRKENAVTMYKPNRNGVFVPVGKRILSVGTRMNASHVTHLIGVKVRDTWYLPKRIADVVAIGDSGEFAIPTEWHPL